MNCKTCNYSIETAAKYCLNCGAKIVEERLSLKGTWEEFIGPFFSWDNNFWRTFFGMFKNPKDVLEAYINGARKKYFHPFSYIVLYATIAVFFYKFFPIEFSDGFSNGLNTDKSPKNDIKIEMNLFLEWLMGYYNFLVLSLIPVYSLTSYLVYYKKGHNFFEHLVFNSYLQSNLGFISLLLQVILVTYFGITFQTFSLLLIIIFILFTLFALKKLYTQNFKQVLTSGILYILIFLGFYIIVFFIASILFIGFLLPKI